MHKFISKLQQLLQFISTNKASVISSILHATVANV